MQNFDYHKPNSVDEAVAHMQASDDGKFLAGGMTMLPTMKQGLAAPEDLIDLHGIDGIAGVAEGADAIEIGAMTSHSVVASSALIQSDLPALAALAESIGDRQVRARGTLGGSISNNDPAADYPAALVALGATVKTNTREIPAEDFFVEMFETALAEDEIVTSVSFPLVEKAAYAKFPNPASRYAMVGVFVAKNADGVRVAVTGAGPSVFRASAMESALDGDFSSSALDGVAVSADDLNSDIHASPEYRAHLVGVMAKRAVDACG
jgi:aerobic carbon-monoxide dehydrogenase medium subunit